MHNVFFSWLTKQFIFVLTDGNSVHIITVQLCYSIVLGVIDENNDTVICTEDLYGVQAAHTTPNT